MPGHRTRFHHLAVFQTLAGLAVLPFVVHGAWEGGQPPALLVALGWLTLAAFNALGGRRLPEAAHEASLYASTALVLAQTVVIPSPAIQVLAGPELLVLGLAAACALPALHVRIWLVLTCGLYLLVLALHAPSLDIWIGTAVVAMVVATTLAVLHLLQEVTLVSEHDPLTGALNRAGLRSRAEMVQALSLRTGSPTSVVFIDLDGFKPFNDRHGHVAGDRLLVDLVRGFRHHMRPSDLIARIGGDEFVLLLPGVTPDQAEAVVARLARHAPLGFTHGTWQWHPGEEFLTAVDEADRLMYQHKQRRRRRVPGPAH
jgi:GGDEF domain-containing protein